MVVHIIVSDNSRPMASTQLKYLMIEFSFLLTIHQQSLQVLLYFIFLPLIDPVRTIALILQRYDHHICIIISSNNMFMGIYQIIRQRVTNLIHFLFSISTLSQQIVHTMQTTLKRYFALAFKILTLILLLTFHIENVILQFYYPTMYSRSYKSHGKIGPSRDPLNIETIKYKYSKPLYHHRTFSDNCFEEQLLRLQKIELENQLNQEKFSHHKSLKIIDELLVENKKYKNKVKQERKEDHSSRNIKNQKLFQALQTKPSLKIKGNEDDQKTERKQVRTNQINVNPTKNAIFKKLYEDKKTNHNIVKNVLQKSHQEHQQILLKEEIKYLKEQLQQKNKLIIDMQCEILKKNKERQMEDENKIMMIIPQKKTMLNNKIIRQQVQFSYGALGRRMTEASVNTDQGNGDEKVRRQSMKQEYAQTSDNFYDYIEETYLQWFYQKQYEKLKQKNSSK